MGVRVWRKLKKRRFVLRRVEGLNPVPEQLMKNAMGITLAGCNLGGGWLCFSLVSRKSRLLAMHIVKLMAVNKFNELCHYFRCLSTFIVSFERTYSNTGCNILIIILLSLFSYHFNRNKTNLHRTSALMINEFSPFRR